MTTPTTPIPVVLDVDTGVDDAHALLLALRHPSLQVLAVTTVNGNSPVPTVTSATLRVLDAAHAPPDLPVAVGCDRPLVEERHNCPQIHGVDSLGDLDPPLEESERTVAKEHAVVFLKRLLEGRIAGGEPPITLIALAPLTNVAMLVRLAPDVVRDGVRRIVWMGGAAMGVGNASAWAEANAGYDPEAAKIVLETCGVPVTMYTWDVYVRVAFDVEELTKHGCCTTLEEEGEEEEEGAKRRVVHTTTTPSWTQLATRLLLRDTVHFSQSSAQIGDAGAVAAVIAPHAVTTRRYPVTVELSGSRTRGMTVVDLREYVVDPDTPRGVCNVDVVVGVDEGVLKSVFADAVFR